MLKRATAVSAVLMAALLLTGILMLPAAGRDIIRDSDKIIGRVVTATPVSAFDGTYITTVHLDLGDAYIYLEQSDDDNIYIKMEGLFAGKYTLASAERTENDQNILDIWRDTDQMFFGGQPSSYLLWKGLFEKEASAAVLRVPPHVAVTTGADPWQLSYPGHVRFANRDYYDKREWDSVDQEETLRVREVQELTRQMLENYDAQRTEFVTDLESDWKRRYSGGSTAVTLVDTDIGVLAQAASARMGERLFPWESTAYDRDTLSALLTNSLLLAGVEAREKARADLGYTESYDRSSETEASAQRAETAFRELYRKYLESAAPPDG